MIETYVREECVACQNRLGALERLSVAHAAKLMDHDSELTSLRVSVAEIKASQTRAEEGTARILQVMERLLDEVRKMRGEDP